MRQPRTFSERLALLNRLNRREAVLPVAEEEDESEDESALGVEEDDSDSDLDDNLDDSDDNGSVSDSEDENDFSGEEEDEEDEEGEEEEEDEEEEEEEEEGAVLPTAPPAAGVPAPGVGQPEASESPDGPEASAAPEASSNPAASAAPEASSNPAAPATPEESAEPESAAGSMTIINPAPTGVANNPAVPSSAAESELSTTEQIVSQITSAAAEATPSPSNSLAQEEKESTETASDAEASASATSEGANDAGESSAQALGRGQEAGIIFGAIAGLGLMMSAGFVLFKWRKRRKASVYDRPPPPGIYSEDEKRDAEVGVAQVPGEQPAGGNMFQVVNSWIQGTPNRYSRGAEVAPPAPPAPAFLTPGRNRDTMNTGITGSDGKWG